MLAGVGTDIVEIHRMEQELQRPGCGFRDEVFTPCEVQQSDRARHPARRLAQMFAAKEALFKALGTGWSGGMSWREVQVLGDSGQPELTVAGELLRHTQRLGVRRMHLSVTHTRQLAMASVVLES
jgi:holo-[acyl-carrier protein] synthase